jgi:hypothetical protein
MSEHKPSRPVHVNQGIQATAVNADVLAVGLNATASKTVYGGDQHAQVAQAVSQLVKALDALQLQANAKAAIAEDVTNLRAAVEKGPSADRVGGILQSLAGKLRMVGIVLTQAAALSEPVTKIASLLRIPLHLLGL